MGIAGGVDFVLNLRSDLLVAAMVICGSWADFSARGRGERGRNVSCDPTTRYRTRYSPSLTPKWCPLRHAIPVGDAEIVFEGGAHKRTYAGTRGTFTTAAERIALTRKNRLSLTKRNIGKPLVNNRSRLTLLFMASRTRFTKQTDWQINVRPTWLNTIYDVNANCYQLALIRYWNYTVVFILRQNKGRTNSCE